MERYEIFKDDAVDALWNEYTKTEEYNSGRIYSINSTHPLVRSAEEHGLGDVINDFIQDLERDGDIKTSFISRKNIDWLDEWKSMHDRLFAFVYKDRGRFRRNGEDVRFGDPGDEDKHKIPKGFEVQSSIVEVADKISSSLQYIDTNDIKHVCDFLAEVHYQFIRVHPFNDGNGRIARVLVDQLSLSLGYIPVLAGFPRTNADKKSAYHAAIQGCIGDANCKTLSEWIFQQMQEKLDQIA